MKKSYVTMGISMYLFVSAVPIANIFSNTLIRMDFFEECKPSYTCVIVYSKGSKLNLS